MKGPIAVIYISLLISFSECQENCGGVSKRLPKSCKMNKSGFLCCNDGVESLINEAMDDLKAERKAKGLKYSEFNLQSIANKVGGMAEGRFNASFNTIVSLSSFASKTRFNGNLLCKVKAGKSFVLSYAAAKRSKGEGWVAAVAAKDQPIGPEEFDGNFHTFTYRI